MQWNYSTSSRTWNYPVAYTSWCVPCAIGSFNGNTSDDWDSCGIRNFDLTKCVWYTHIEGSLYTFFHVVGV